MFRGDKGIMSKIKYDIVFQISSKILNACQNNKLLSKKRQRTVFITNQLKYGLKAIQST